MRAGPSVAALAALVALWPGCLCVAEFPDYLVRDDRGAELDGPRDKKDGPGAAEVGTRDAGIERKRDLPIQPPEGSIPNPERRDLRLAAHTGSETVTCTGTGAACTKAGAHCTITGDGACIGVIDCGKAAICVVNCGGSAASLVNCNQATQCFVSCKGGACDTIECGKTGYCDVKCTSGACSSINCGTSCGCKVTCDANSCGGPTAYLKNVSCHQRGTTYCGNPTGCDPCVAVPCIQP